MFRNALLTWFSCRSRFQNGLKPSLKLYPHFYVQTARPRDTQCSEICQGQLPVAVLGYAVYTCAELADTRFLIRLKKFEIQGIYGDFVKILRGFLSFYFSHVARFLRYMDPWIY